MRHFLCRAEKLGIPVLLVLCLLWLAGCGALVTSTPPIQATGSTAIAQAYPTPQGTRMVYHNALTTQAQGWANSPQCVFTSNGLSVRPSSGQAYICLAPTAPLTDAAITVKVQQSTGSPTHAFGIAFRHASPKNYYFFGVDGRGRFTLTVVVNDVSHNVIPFTAKPAIHTGANATNQLQVIMKGQNVTLLVNGTAIGQATLTTFASGTVGLRGINDGAVEFQQLAIAPV